MHGVDLSNMEYVNHIDQNVEMLKPAEKCRQESSAKSHPFLAPTPPSEPKSESSRIQIQPSARPPASSMSSIKSKAPQEEPRDLSLKRPWQLWPIWWKIPRGNQPWKRRKSFKDPVAKPVEKKRESFPRFPYRRSERSRRTSSSKDRRCRVPDRRSVSPERRQLPYVAVPHPTPSHFQYMKPS